jgi:hypothetical protein
LKIAVLAWGSLILEPKTLSIQTAFKPIGPRLPIEFSRLSRDGRLTLVIDEANGASCPTYVARSAFDALDPALENLWIREGGGGEPPPQSIRNHGRVGFVDRISETRSDKAIERHLRATETIETWATANAYDAVIWTTLASNFSEKADCEPFSTEAAMRYLEVLDQPTLELALNYIRKAPPEIQTPTRLAVNSRWPEGQIN